MCVSRGEYTRLLASGLHMRVCVCVCVKQRKGENAWCCSKCLDEGCRGVRYYVCAC